MLFFCQASTWISHRYTHIFCADIGFLLLFVGFSRQEYWSGLPFPSPVTTFCENSPHGLSLLGGPTRHGSQFHGVRQGCDPHDLFVHFSVTVVFTLSALWWMRIRGLWKLPDGRDWLWGKLGLILVGGARLRKRWIQLSVDGRGCVLSLLFGRRQSVVPVVVAMVTFKRTCAHTVVFSAWTPQQATVDPCLHQRRLDTQREVWLSLLWGHCSSLLAPGVHKALCCVCTNKLVLQVCVPSPVEVLKSNLTGLQRESLGLLSPSAGSPGWEICCGS